MGTMNFSIPDDVKDKFNEVFKDENKSAVITRLMRQAVEDEERRQRDVSFADRVRRRLESSPGFTEEQIRKVREDGRP
jgi:hypothetical protein